MILLEKNVRFHMFVSARNKPHTEKERISNNEALSVKLKF